MRRPRKVKLPPTLRGHLVEQIAWLRETIREEREAHRKERAELYTRLQLWNPMPSVTLEPQKLSQSAASQGPQLSAADRDAFEYAEKLGRLGLKSNPDGEGVIEISSGELWESAGEYEAQKLMDAARVK